MGRVKEQLLLKQEQDETNRILINAITQLLDIAQDASKIRAFSVDKIEGEEVDIFQIKLTYWKNGHPTTKEEKL